MPAIWAYAAEHQPDGDLSGFTDKELALAISYSGDAPSMLQALLQARFLDEDFKIHNWEHHNGYHVAHKEKARNAAKARWDKERKKQREKEEDISESDKNRGEESARARRSAPSNAPSIPGASETADRYHKHARAALFMLNESSGSHFREVDSNLAIISARLREPGVDIDGIRLMVDRQCKRWKGTSQAEYLRPETLFGKSKFDSYYANREQPIISDINGSSPNGQREARRANEYPEEIRAKRL